jgi:predicted HTH domain antitoxin
MLVTVDVPENVARSLGEQPEAVGRQLLEQAAIEGYRSQRISRGQVREMLGLSWYGTEEFLAKHGCVRPYTSQDLEEDWQNNQKLLAAR